MNQFAIDTTQLVSPEPTYSHGFSEEEVTRIKTQREAIKVRDLVNIPVTLDEFQKIIVPWNRIYRTEQFILHPPKVKKASTRVTKPRIAKVKKLTKKAIGEKLNDIIFKQAMGNEVTSDEEKFLLEHTKALEIL